MQKILVLDSEFLIKKLRTAAQMFTYSIATT